MINSKKINPTILLLLTAIIIISLKWLTSYSFYPSEPLVNKIIFDLEDHLYFPHILNLSNLNLTPDYLTNYVPNKIIPIPIYSLVFHSLSYIIFSEYGFIVIEYFALFLFLSILFKIFEELNFNTHFSIVFALVIFLLPEFFIYFKHLNINLINFDIIRTLYSFRIPRPLVSNIYFFWGLLLAIYYNKYENKNYFYILIGINLALNFGSVYYNFVVLSVLFFILFLNKMFKNNKDYFLFLIKKIFIIFTFFLLFSLPFIIILFFSEADFAVRMGSYYTTITQKKYLLSYIMIHFLSLKFLLFFFINTILLFILLKKQIFFCKKSITVLYLFFVSTCISIVIFILFSPLVSELYHFVNLIVVTGILLFFIFIILISANIIIKNVRNYKNYKFLSKNNSYFLFTILLLSIAFNLNYFVNYKKNINLDFRKDINILYNYLNQNNNNKKLKNILTFNTRAQVWWLLLGNNKFSTIDSSLSSLNFHDLELSFINNLKFLNVSKKNFQKIIDNKKARWRYDNKYIKYISWYKYQANSLVTYNNSQNFEDEVLKYIKNSSPLKSQQIIVPHEEIKRLTKLFDNTNNLYFKNPDIIVLEKNSLIKKYSNINLNEYCLLKTPQYLYIYVNLEKTNCDHV